MHDGLSNFVEYKVKDSAGTIKKAPSGCVPEYAIDAGELSPQELMEIMLLGVDGDEDDDENVEIDDDD